MSLDQPRRVTAQLALSTIRHRLPLILLCGVLGAALGLFLAVSRPPLATATTQVYVYPLAGNPYGPTPGTDPAVSLETEAQVVTSDDVVGSAAQQVGMKSDELRRHLQVTVPTNTQLLDIAVQDSNADDALHADEAVATAYLALRTAQADALFKRQASNVDDRITQVEQDLSRLTNQPASTVDTALRRSLVSELINLRAQRVDLVSSRSEPGRVIEAAKVSAGSRTMQLALLIAGQLVGLLIGLTLALAVERRLGRARRADDVTAAGLPVLVDLTAQRRSIDQAQLESAARFVRGAVVDASPRGGLVSVCGLGDRSQGALFTSSLASSLARAGLRTVLVDAVSAEETGREGLIEVLAGERDGGSLLQPTGTPGLWWLPRGRSGESSKDFFMRGLFASRLRPMAQTFDYTIVQGPELDTPEGEAVAQASDVVVLVMVSGAVRETKVAETVARAKELDVRLLGAVLMSRGAAARAGRGSHADVTPSVPVEASVAGHESPSSTLQS
jgi:polysaccharide biosynthesis transport protein